MAQLDLDRIREMLEKALEENDFEKLSRLAPIVDALYAGLQQDLQRDPVYSRVMRDRQNASAEDIAYANALTGQLGKARQISSLVQQGLVALGATAGGVTAAGQALKPAIARSTAATGAAARGIRSSAGTQTQQATRARAAASRAGGDVGRATQAVQRAAAHPAVQVRAGAEPPPKGSIGKAQKTLRTAVSGKKAAEGASGAATRGAARKTAQAAATRKAATGWGQLAATRAAPKLASWLGLRALGMAELALTPLLEFYKTDRELASFVGQLESMAKTSPDGKLSIEAMTNEQANALNASPDLAKLLWDQGALDRSVYAYIFGPDAAIEEGLYGESEIQRGRKGGESEPFRAPDPLKDSAWQQTAGEMEKIGGSVPRLGADEAGMAEVPTPQRRRMAAENAVAKRAQVEAMSTDIGEKPEGKIDPIDVGSASTTESIAAATAETPGPRLGLQPLAMGRTPSSLKPGEEIRPLRAKQPSGGTLEMTLRTDAGDEVQARIAESRSKKTGNIFKKLVDALAGAGDTPSGQAADAAMPQDMG